MEPEEVQTKTRMRNSKLTSALAIKLDKDIEILSDDFCYLPTQKKLLANSQTDYTPFQLDEANQDNLSPWHSNPRFLISAAHQPFCHGYTTEDDILPYPYGSAIPSYDGHDAIQPGHAYPPYLDPRSSFSSSVDSGSCRSFNTRGRYPESTAASSLGDTSPWLETPSTYNPSQWLDTPLHLAQGQNMSGFGGSAHRDPFGLIIQGSLLCTRADERPPPTSAPAYPSDTLAGSCIWAVGTQNNATATRPLMHHGHTVSIKRDGAQLFSCQSTDDFFCRASMPNSSSNTERLLVTGNDNFSFDPEPYSCHEVPGESQRVRRTCLDSRHPFEDSSDLTPGDVEKQVFSHASFDQSQSERVTAARGGVAKSRRLRCIKKARTIAGPSSKDDFLVHSKQSGMSYKDIRLKGNFDEAESTLRGRFRCLTKHKENRVRRPEWQDRDIAFLKQGVFHYATDKYCSEMRGSPTPTAYSLISSVKVPWKKVAQYIIDQGGSYHFGYATCRKKWDEIVEKEGLDKKK